jgi:hypothetical protein
MLLIKMSSAMLIDTPPLNRWDKGSIRPGPVGSVGDALTAVRIKQSDPDLPWKFSKAFSGTNAPNRGSNVQDGSYASYSDGGYGAEVEKRKRQKKTHVGTFMQQMSGNDRTFQSIMAPQPQVGFQTQAQAILHRQGDKFQSLPGGYGPNPGQLLRGGQVPRVVFNEGNDPSLRGVNGGGQNSVVLPVYPTAPMPSVVMPENPIRNAPFQRASRPASIRIPGAFPVDVGRYSASNTPMSARSVYDTTTAKPYSPDLFAPSSVGSSTGKTSSGESTPTTPRGLYPTNSKRAVNEGHLYPGLAGL